MKRYVLMLIAALIPASLQAQEAPPPWKGLDSSALSTVFVREHSGVETRGQLLRLDSDEIVVLVNGSERRFETERVARVSRRGDSLKNGALTGLVIGLAQAIAILSTQECRLSCDKRALGGLLVGNTVMYTALGTALDAAIQGRTVLYQAPAPRRTVASRGGAALSVRWTW
jgi:hypothetical protein